MKLYLAGFPGKSGGINCSTNCQQAAEKTVVFTEIVKRYTELYAKKAIVLTHRLELCKQTSRTLKNAGVNNKAITSSVAIIADQNPYCCYVAMVETLKNRLRDKMMKIDDIGLVIIDEAHHNSFRKLLGKFKNAFIIGVTATPLSSDVTRPMHKSYDELITSENIPALIEKGFLAKAVTYGFDVELTSLKVGTKGDYTIKSSDELYSSQAMLNLLVEAYESRSKGQKTLIFNNGIHTSLQVFHKFSSLGLPIKHLDNNTSAAERIEVLNWFRKTPGGILTSVSILTTGFDEPSVQTVIINRATKSLTLYYQMIGRGSRRLPNKKTFTIIDLGNNVSRFGLWSNDVDWEHVFKNPGHYLEQGSESGDESHIYILPHALRSLFPASSEVSFDVVSAYRMALENHVKPKIVIRDSIRQHAFMCIANAQTIADARKLAEALKPDIEYRVKQFTMCLDKPSKSYREWLMADYKHRLHVLIGKIFHKVDASAPAHELKKL